MALSLDPSWPREAARQSHWIAIVNPAAGGGRCGRLATAQLESLRAGFASSGRTLETSFTRSGADATAIARDALRRGVTGFLAVGGDGTAFEVLNGMLGDGPAVTATAPLVLGFLPLGTGNSFVRDHTRDGIAFCRDALVAGRSRRVDLLRLRHRGGELLALGVVSLGFGADVASLVNRRFKPFGKLGYSLGVLAEVARLAPATVRLGLDGCDARDEALVLLCACNNRYVGGNMEMAPRALTDDGLLDLVTVGPVGRLDLLRTFPRIFAGTHVDHPAVTVRQASRLTFEMAEPVSVMVDGESLRLAIESVEVLPAALTVAL